MPIDPSAVGAETGPTEGYWTSKDCLLYALGVGAGTADLAFTTDSRRNLVGFSGSADAGADHRSRRKDRL